MSARGSIVCLIICSVLCLWICSPEIINATDVRQGLEAWGIPPTAALPATGLDIKEDSADVAIGYSAAYPGSREFLVTIYLSNPVAIAGFDFEMIITPGDLADFSTVRVYVDSLDTCPELETCWYYYPVRECLIQRGPWIGDWSIFEAHGAVGDTTSPACDTLWMIGITFGGTAIPPQPGYVPLLHFGVDFSCVSDTLQDRTVTFDFTGHLSSQFGELVPFRTIQGKLDLLWSLSGDSNADSLVDLGDVVCLVNYLYKSGPNPCMLEAADPNADCVVDLGDVIYLINFLFKGGPPPQRGCAH